jgi:hypothetical protein
MKTLKGKRGERLQRNQNLAMRQPPQSQSETHVRQRTVNIATSVLG